MTVITNYSDLSPAMRASLASGGKTGTMPTLEALESRGLLTLGRTADEPFALTEAGRRAAAVLANPDTPPPPAKVAPLLDRATAGGLTVKRDDFGLNLETAASWTIKSPSPMDNTEVWIHWTKGPNGGRLNMRRYYPNLTNERQRVTKQTRQGVVIVLDMMIRSLARHVERQQAEVDRIVAECSLGTINQALEAAEKSGAEHYIELYSMAKAKFMANAQAALGQVFAELDGAVVDVPDGPGPCSAEGCTRSARPAADTCRGHGGQEGQVPACGFSWVAEIQLCPRCGLGAANHDPSWPSALEQPRLLECGCPVQVAADCGHQEGCATLEQPDPTRPGWFMIDQIIIDKLMGDCYQVCIVESDGKGTITAVAVTVNGGYGKQLIWFGERDDARGPLSMLERDQIGLPEFMRRSWPRTGRTAKVAVENLLQEQCLSGWVSASSHAEVHVLLQPGTDPYRHSVLIPRYLPYRDATVTVRPGAMVGPTIVIKHEAR